MKHGKTKRTTQAKFMLLLSVVTGLGIMPFVVFRALQQDWVMVVLDMIIVVGMGLIFIYTYKTNETKYTSIGFVIIAQISSLISFYLNGGNIINWIYPAMLSIFFVVKPKNALIINSLLIIAYFPKLNLVFSMSDNMIIVISVVVTNIIAYSFTQGLRVQELELRKLASEDYLTKTGNRRALNIKLEEVYKLLKNHDNTASLLLIDLDHFKKVNDTHGHLRGDVVLIDLIKLLKSHINGAADIYRYGGEEFIVVCYNIGIDIIYQHAESFRKIVKNQLNVEGKEITISIGVAEYIKEESLDDWMHRVDLALYQAKNQGRNRTVKA